MLMKQCENQKILNQNAKVFHPASQVNTINNNEVPPIGKYCYQHQKVLNQLKEAHKKRKHDQQVAAQTNQPYIFNRTKGSINKFNSKNDEKEKGNNIITTKKNHSLKPRSTTNYEPIIKNIVLPSNVQQKSTPVYTHNLNNHY